jgi:hypothetical protein
MDIENQIKMAIERMIESFGNENHLSEFSRGQIDGLRWAIEAIEAIVEEKSPTSD